MVRGCLEVCGLVSVADAVRALIVESGSFKQGAWATLFVLAAGGMIGLRNESGASRFSDADLVLCPPDGHGGRFTTLRILPGGAS